MTSLKSNITSMTGFGRSVIEAPLGRIIVEIQSVNRKYLEVFVSMPKEYGRFETEVRKVVGEHVLRGQISVRIQVLPNVSSAEYLLPDVSMLKALKEGWEKIGKALGYEKGSIDLPFLVQHMSTTSKAEIKDEDFAPIGDCLLKALTELSKMKRTEGKALVRDISSRLKNLSAHLNEIEKHAPDAVLKMKKKLKERLDEIFQPSSEVDDRLLKEVALFAEKVDISEEITRFRSHVSQYEALLKEDSGGVGRKMDFLVQEMGREVNTIGSKSMESKISHLVVEMKSELEKIREQIQNIE